MSPPEPVVTRAWGAGYPRDVPHSQRPRRPSFREPGALEALGERSDPIGELHIAHETAAVLLHAGRAADDPAVTERLIAIVDEIGLPTLADLWASRPAGTLPGTLWRLYLLREWMQVDPASAAREYTAGVPITEPNHAVAGVDPPGPDEIATVADEILRGAFTGDFGVALDRASAFCRVVVAGRAHFAEGTREIMDAAKLRDLADDFTASARLWRAGKLD